MKRRRGLDSPASWSTDTVTTDTPNHLPTTMQPHRDPEHRCGERIPCPEHGLPWGPLYRPAERLHNGTVIAHDCGQTWRPFELAA